MNGASPQEPCPRVPVRGGQVAAERHRRLGPRVRGLALRVHARRLQLDIAPAVPHTRRAALREHGRGGAEFKMRVLVYRQGTPPMEDSMQVRGPPGGAGKHLGPSSRPSLGEVDRFSNYRINVLLLLRRPPEVAEQFRLEPRFGIRLTQVARIGPNLGRRWPNLASGRIGPELGQCWPNMGGVGRIRATFLQISAEMFAGHSPPNVAKSVQHLANMWPTSTSPGRTLPKFGQHQPKSDVNCSTTCWGRHSSINTILRSWDLVEPREFRKCAPILGASVASARGVL